MILNDINRGVTIGSIAIFISCLGAALTFPFLQEQRDKLDCDALCYGTMQSARSGLSLIGTVLIGRLSDRYGRASLLWLGTIATLSSYIINYNGSTITHMWLSMIPNALLNQNFSVLKALIADYSEQYSFSETERVSSVGGRLGMAVGLSFMIGPILGATLLSNYKESILVAISFVLVSAGCLSLLPIPQIKPKGTQTLKDTLMSEKDTNITEKDQQPKKSMMDLLYLPALRKPGAKIILCMRLSMGLAFSIFMTVWTVSLNKRFEFGPKQHAYFMGWVGLWYALSQGFFAKQFMKFAGANPTNLLLLCILCLSIGRLLAVLTTSIVAVYILMAIVIIALGIMNTAMSTACSRLAGIDEVGGLYGVLEASESLSGFFGPTIGGLLFRVHSNLPIVGVILLYMIVFVIVYLYYDFYIVYKTTTSKQPPLDSEKEVKKEMLQHNVHTNNISTITEKDTTVSVKDIDLKEDNSNSLNNKKNN